MLRVPFRNTNIIPKAQSPNIASGQKTVTHSLPHFHLETLAPPLIPPRKIPSLVPNGPPIPYRRRRHGQSPHRCRLSFPSGDPPSTMNGMGCRPPFTPSQLEELQHQALIFKHLVTGIPVPPELLLSLRRPPPRFYHHPALGYCTYYGKKLDPEPGRCRRTDGKKWRCSKEAHPDSKYCERHMHRSRSRSRKPVESSPSPSLSQSQSSPSSTVTSLAATSGFRSVAGSFQSIPLQQQQHSVGGGSSMQSACLGGATASQQLNMDLGCYGTGNKEYRYPYGAKALSDEHSFFSESSGGLGVDSSLDISWGLMPSHVSSPLSNSKVSDNCVLQSAYPQFHSMQDLEQLSKPQQQYSFFGCDYGSTEPVKLGSQSLRPFFDEWPRAKDAWSDLEDERSNRNSFSNTQLAISIPMTSSDLSTTTSTSPNDD